MPLSAFWTLDPNAVRAACAELDAAGLPAVTSADAPTRAPSGGFVYAAAGLHSPALFGEDGRQWARLDVPGLVHPAALPAIAARLGLSVAELSEVLEGRGGLIEGRYVPEGHDDFYSAEIGALAVGERIPDEPLARIARIPVPPAAERPFVTHLGTEMVDPWIGPWGEAWAELVFRARRLFRLSELNAPVIVVDAESAALQSAFTRVFAATRAPKRFVPPAPRPPRVARLVPPLVRPMPRRRPGTVLAVAVDGDRIVVQRAGDVLVLDRAGALLSRHPPGGCLLRGVVDGVAIFREYVQHPHLGSTGFGPDHVAVEDGVTVLAPTDLEASALDLDRGWLPEAALGAHVSNDQPEDLFVEDADGVRVPVRIGGDRPQALAFAPGMRFAWVGEGEETMVLDLATGVPQCFPAWAQLATEALSLGSGALRVRRSDAFEEDSPTAVHFDGATWRFLWPSGIVADAACTRCVRLRPSPTAAAFAADGALVLVVRREVVVLDRGFAVVARFALPD